MYVLWYPMQHILPLIRKHLWFQLPKPATPIIQFPVPSTQQVVVGVADIFAGIHPNFIGIGLLFVLVGVFFYIKIKYPFWNLQPVYHTYDAWRWFQYSPYIVQKIPIKTRYFDKDKMVETRLVADLDRPQFQQIWRFVQSHYIPSDRILFDIYETEFKSQFIGHNGPVYVSVYHSPVCSADTSGDMVVQTAIISGCVFSKPVQIAFANNTEIVDAFYIDYLCVHREKPELARTTFQTHEYRCRILSPDIRCSVFRKEVELCPGVVPFVEFDVCTYYLRNFKVENLPPKYQIVHIRKENASLLHDFWANLSTPANLGEFFDVAVFPDIGAWIAQIREKRMWVCCLMRDTHVYAVYILQNTRLLYEELDGKGALCCAASVCNCDNQDLFNDGFLHAVRSVLKENNEFRLLTIDAVGHNVHLDRAWLAVASRVMHTKAAYYTFNLVVPATPMATERVFVCI